MILATGYDWSSGVQNVGTVKPKIVVYEMKKKDISHSSKNTLY